MNAIAVFYTNTIIITVSDFVLLRLVKRTPGDRFSGVSYLVCGKRERLKKDNENNY